MTNEEAIKSFKNLYEDIDKENHLFIGTINPEFIMMAIQALEANRNIINGEIFQGYIHLMAENERLHETLEAQPRWIPVSERLPEIGQKILLKTKDFGIVVGIFEPVDYGDYKEKCFLIPYSINTNKMVSVEAFEWKII